ncbi:MAG TPA: VPLPA-CTERM-specific exosortase XrtD [Desulfomonilia bacterium]|nr:VPLPA-CTERM-specific exosortase XrtD [Desulfomonilia bacterium]
MADNRILATKGVFLIASAFLASFLLFYWGTLRGLWNLWYTDGDYSYAMFMPLVTVYILWQKRKEISRTPLGTNRLGGGFFLFFLLISLYGILGSSPSAVRPAVPLIILSIALFCYGTRMFKVLAFPLAVLIFMIPLPTIVQARIGTPLKLIASKLGVLMIRIFGIPVYIEGNVIDLGSTQLQVADACSGMRYILPLFALGVLFGYFFEKVRWKQIALALGTIPIAIIANAFRVGMTGILTRYYGPRAAEGFFHDFSGWLVFMIAFALLFLFQAGLRLIPVRRTAGASGHDSLQTDISGPARPLNIVPPLICTGALLLSGFLVYSTSSLPPLHLKGGFEMFPPAIGDWKGKPDSMDREMIALSGAEEALSAVYADKDGKAVSLYIGYRGSPFNESENFFHSPSICMPSSGWNIDRMSSRMIRKVAQFGDIKVQELMTEKLENRQLVYYWFQTRNRISDDVNINRFHLSLHALMQDNTYDLFIRPITPMSQDESIKDAEQRMDRFVREMMPVLLKFIKDNQKPHG